MNVVFEFLSEEPIENLITSMRFKIGKAVYFGYHDTIEKLKDSTTNFLKKYCDGEQAVFHAMSRSDVQSMTKTMRQAIEYEKSQGNSTYFDMTGGEEAILIAFGLLAGEYDTPMHAFDIEKNKLSRLEEGSSRAITDCEPRDFDLDLDKYVEMHGGRINYNLHKASKNINDPEFSEDVEKLWSIENDFTEEWNLLSIFLRTHMMPEASLEVNCDLEKTESLLRSANNRLNTLEKFNRIMDRLGAEGLLQDLMHSDGVYSFRYKDKAVRDCLRDGGSTLELYVYKREQADSDDCKVGVHLDWDGVLHAHTSGTADTNNEIDVILMQGAVPVFISCKNGVVAEDELFKLNTVADRFGGRYVKKVLIATTLGKRTARSKQYFLERAKDMGITVIDGVHKLSEQEFREQLLLLAKN
jgi:hypothetical protein